MISGRKMCSLTMPQQAGAQMFSYVGLALARCRFIGLILSALFAVVMAGTGFSGETSPVTCRLDKDGFILQAADITLAKGIGRIALKDSADKTLAVLSPSAESVKISEAGKEKTWAWESRAETAGIIAKGKVAFTPDGITYGLEYEFDREFEGSVDPSLDLFPEQMASLCGRKYACENTQGMDFQGSFPTSIPDQLSSLPPIRDYSGINRPLKKLKIFLDGREVEISVIILECKSDGYNNFYYGGNLKNSALLDLGYRRQGKIPAGFLNSLTVQIRFVSKK